MVPVLIAIITELMDHGGPARLVKVNKEDDPLSRFPATSMIGVGIVGMPEAVLL